LKPSDATFNASSEVSFTKVLNDCCITDSSLPIIKLPSKLTKDRYPRLLHGDKIAQLEQHLVEHCAGKPGRPLDLATMGSKKIKTALTEGGIEWHAWHASRRGLATNLHELGIQDRVIQAIMRHGSIGVTQNIYIKQLPAPSIKAMRRLADRWKAKK
jgi:integrase